MSAAFKSPRELLAYLGLHALTGLICKEAAQSFPFLVTRAYAARITKGDARDPLLRQVLPVDGELLFMPGFSADPLQDITAIAAPGVLHKYRGRVLLITTGACAIHCRYCFRRAFPYSDAQLHKSDEDAALDYVANDASIHEVILSGGDPLLLSDDRLTALLSRLAGIPHLKRLRIHSRVPIVLPSRITPELITLLTATRLRTALVIHANHPRELDGEVAIALSSLRAADVLLLNQAVLLRGVNDRTETLTDLSEALFQHGVLPYYLHLLDKTSGTAHFDLPLRQSLDLYEQLRNSLPGYLLPRLVREQPGQPAKTPAERLTGLAP